MEKENKKLKWHFRVISGWTLHTDVINIELFSIHWEKDFVFWIEFLGICFHWEKY